MPRKQTQHPKDWEKPFPSRLRKLMDETGTTQEKLSAYLGVSRQAVSYYSDSSSLPNSETVAKIAQFFGVSADWLLGLTDARTVDTSVRAICDYTGLSEEAIQRLHDLSRNDSNRVLYVLNDAINDHDFRNALAFMYDYAFLDAGWANKLRPAQKGIYIGDELTEEDAIDVLSKNGRVVLSDIETIDFYKMRSVFAFEAAVEHFRHEFSKQTEGINRPIGSGLERALFFRKNYDGM